jgi:hypothetical protein
MNIFDVIELDVTELDELIVGVDYVTDMAMD